MDWDLFIEFAVCFVGFSLFGAIMAVAASYSALNGVLIGGGVVVVIYCLILLTLPET